MAETDKIIELGREPGFFRSVFNVVYPASSQMLHLHTLIKCKLCMEATWAIAK